MKLAPLVLSLATMVPAFAQGGLEWVHSPAQDLGFPGAYALATFDSGSGPAVYVGGVFPVFGNTTNIVRWNGVSWSVVGAGLTGGFVASLHVHDDGTGPALYAGGNFASSGATNLRGIGRWNGSAWTSLSGGLNGGVETLTTFDDGTGPALYAGGDFTFVGGVGASKVARWDGVAWSALPPLPTQVQFVVSIAVHTDASGTSLFAGGIWQQSGFNRGFVARLSGASWTEITPFGGANASVLELLSHDDGTGAALYAAGNFQDANGTAANSIAKRTTSGSWAPLAGGLNQTVVSLVTYDDGTGPALYAAGGFTGSNPGVALGHVGRWTPAGWSKLGSGMVGESCYALCVASLGGAASSDLYAAGNFIFAGGSAAQSFARWTGCGDAGGPYCFGDGSGGGTCPCGNTSPTSDRSGCRNSTGTGGRLAATGLPRVANDTLVLTATGLPSTATVLFFEGTVRANHGSGTLFGDGLRCVSGSVKRLGFVLASAGAASFPGVGDAPIHIAGDVAPGTTRMYQALYRNGANFCTTASSNMTNAWVVGWKP